MKTIVSMTFFFSVLAAYYIYNPLPTTVSEPWKLMLLDATFRGIIQMGNMAEFLGICHRTRILNFAASRSVMAELDSEESVRVSNTIMDGVEVQVFETTQGPEGRLKRAVVYIHGGGWALGSSKTGCYDLLCRKMARDLDAVIVSVEYRLAPEVRFPVQYDDVFRASKHFLRSEVLARYSVDPDRLAVSGDSAGGNLAAAVAQQIATDSSVSVKFKSQALIYPVLQALDFNTPSYQQNQNMPILYRSLMIDFWLEYLGADPSFLHPMLVNNHTALDLPAAGPGRAKLDWISLLQPNVRKSYRPVAPAHGTARILEEVPALLDPRANPLLAEQVILEQAPQAYILTCEHDVLRDDGLMYGRRLEEAGVTVTIDHYEDGFHGCMAFAFWPVQSSVGLRSMENYITWLNENL